LDAVRQVGSRRQVWAGDRALKIDTLPWPFALLCWNTHMHFCGYPRIPRRAKTTIEAEGISNEKQTNRSSPLARVIV
jgi:hypothetical protein